MRSALPALLLCASAAAHDQPVVVAAHWLRLRVPDSMEVQRGPPVQRRGGENGMLLHDAEPATRYRYRQRTRCRGPCGDEGWSAWTEVVTPAAPIAAPPAPTSLRLVASGSLRLTLSWTFEGDVRDVNGWLIERCDDAHRCEPAALVHPDVRTFELVVLETRGYRVAAFNEHGVSGYTEIADDPLDRDGVDPPQDGASVDLTPADSIAATAITVDPAASDSDACESPALLEALGELSEGVPMFELIGVQGGDSPADVYRDNDGCGANCLYLTYATVDGCYRKIGEIFGTAPPFVGRIDRSPGLRKISQRGNAGHGRFIVMDGSEEIDGYAWCSPPEDVTTLRPPFEHYPCQAP